MAEGKEIDQRTEACDQNGNGECDSSKIIHSTPLGTTNRDWEESHASDSPLPTSALPLPPLPHPDALVFFSPSGVKAVSSALESLQWPVDDILLVAVGPTTLKALEAKGFRNTAMAEKPNPERVVDAVVKSFS